VDVAQIKRHDINLIDGTIIIRKQQKTGALAYLPLPDDLVADVKIYLKEKISSREEWLFPGKRKGTHLVKESINYIINNIVKAAGIDHITPHDFRATFLTRAGTMGIPPKMIIDALNISYSTVMQYYQSFTPEEQKDSFSKVHIT
jgi:integrase